MNSTGWVAVIVVLVLIVGGAWWYTQQPTEQTNINVNTIPNETGSNVPNEGTTTEPKTVTVDYSATGFTPKTITINKGDTVTFTNSSAGNMWVASDEHPTHTEFDSSTRTAHCAPGTTPPPFDQCAASRTYSFKFDKTGSFDYHNHSAAEFGGTVVVQ